MSYDSWKADFESMQDPASQVGPTTKEEPMPFAEHAMPQERDLDVYGTVDVDEALRAAWALLPNAASVNLYVEAHQHRPLFYAQREPGRVYYQFCVCHGDGSVMQSFCTGRHPTLSEALSELQEWGAR